MKYLRSFFNFYIDSSVHVALSVVSLVLITIFQFKIAYDIYLLLFIFFGTITGYNFVKYAKIAGLHHRSLAKNLRAIQLFSFFCFGGLVFLATKISIDVLKLALLLGLLTLFYAIPLLKHKNLRSIAGLKILVVAIVWAGVTVLLPLVTSEVPFNTDVWLTFLQRMFIVMTLTLPFEIRDLRFDDKLLKTIPQVLGIRKAKVLGVFFLMLVLLTEGLKTAVEHNELLVLLVILTLMGVFLLGSKRKQSKYFASFFVESIPIVWMLLWCLLIS
ncbi:hypothetical protein [Patiriisocius hiemis]|uniref:Prenyltransferase n=1 Tax=Patiriisocius hiemis TaxID=3075604 RepID=A0ABU2YFF4_9FLAO|nr:hypothetical protein [Constantimarinum sp. W242]MDT0556912.1 hypothetical protein [Constantimarinum sp. W242]